MGKKTPLYDQHLACHARIVDFAGWEMPLHYGSQLEEHKAVRQHAGLFDVSHMNIVDITGAHVKVFLRYLLANDVEKLVPYKALYTCMLNPQGGVIDDLIVYQLSPTHYRLILNAATKTKDLQWLDAQNTFGCHIILQEDLAILALQGPQAINLAESVLSGEFGARIAQLKPFHFAASENILAARTGYTGEDGLELVVKHTLAVDVWHKLISAAVQPVGLGARDTLRLEAGFNLYGQDMDESTSPLTSNLGWTVAFEPADRQFIGREALETQAVTQKLAGLILETGGILRHGLPVFAQDNPQPIGVITSGGFSPELNCSIALARVPLIDAAAYFVNIRGKLLPVILTPPAFVRKGWRLV